MDDDYVLRCADAVMEQIAAHTLGLTERETILIRLAVRETISVLEADRIIPKEDQ